GCWFVALWQGGRVEEGRRLAEARAERDLRLLTESLERTRLVRGFAMEGFEQEQFGKSLERFEATMAATIWTRASSRRGVRTLVALCSAVVLLFVGWAILLPPHEMPFAAGVLMLTAFVAAGLPLQRLARLAAEQEPAHVAANRIQSYLNLIPEVGQ